jgi:hypothetical protein
MQEFWMKTKIRRLSLIERQGELTNVHFVIDPIWENDEVDFFQWARESGVRVQIPTELISRTQSGSRVYGPPKVLELRVCPETIVNPFLLKIYVNSDDASVALEAQSRFALAIVSAYNERKGAEFEQPPWRANIPRRTLSH